MSSQAPFNEICWCVGQYWLNNTLIGHVKLFESQLGVIRRSAYPTENM